MIMSTLIGCWSGVLDDGCVVVEGLSAYDAFYARLNLEIADSCHVEMSPLLE